MAAQIIIGSLSLGVSGFCLYKNHQLTKRSNALEKEPVTSVADAAAKFQTQGLDSIYVHLRGRTVSPEPFAIVGDLSKKRSTLVQNQVLEHIATPRRSVWDAEGIRVERVQNITRGDAILFRDTEGGANVKVLPADASLEHLLTTVVNEYKPVEQSSDWMNIIGSIGGAVQVKGVSLGFEASNRNVRGHSFLESIVPENRAVTALGELRPDPQNPGSFILVPGRGKNRKPFVFTGQSEREFAEATEDSSYWYTLGAVLTGALGGGLVGHTLLFRKSH